jgi:hypothetical protein
MHLAVDDDSRFDRAQRKAMDDPIWMKAAGGGNPGGEGGI